MGIPDDSSAGDDAWPRGSDGEAPRRPPTGEATYRALFEAIDQGFCIIELIGDLPDGAVADLRFVEVNDAFERQTGLAGASGRLMSEIAPGLVPIWLGTLGDVARTGVAARVELHHAFAGRWYESHVSRIGGPGSRQLAAVFRDVTAAKEHEERRAFLLGLNDVLRPLDDADRIWLASATALGRHLKANRVAYAEHGQEDGTVIVARNYLDGADEVVGPMDYADYGPEILSELTRGVIRVQPDIRADPRLSDRQKAALADRGVGASLNVPLVRNGRLAAFLGVNFTAAHPFPQAAIDLAVAVAERTWAAVERARAEAARRTSEELLALAFRTLPVGIAIVDEGGATTMANREMGRFLPSGTIPSFDPDRRDRWRGWDAGGRRVPPEDFPAARALRGEQVAPGMQMLYRDDEGAEIWTEVLSAALRDGDGRITGAIVVVVDVDRLKRSEKAARASDERLSQFGEASQDVLWIRDAATLQWTYLTPAFETIYGIGRDEALAGDNYRNWQNLIVPEDRDRAVAAIGRVIDGEWTTFEYRVRRPSDGTIRWLRDTDFPIADATGKVVMFGGVGHDVTEAKDADLRLQTLIEGMPQLVWRAVDEGMWTWASPQWIDYTGQDEAAYRDWGWLDALHPDDRADARNAWAHALENGGFEVEYRIARSGGGDHRWFQTRAAPVRDQAGVIIEWLGTSTDVHDLRDLQEQQKVLVAELQHRTRNLMGVVRSMADKMSRASDDLADFRERFRDRLDALARVQGLLSRITDQDRVTFDELVDTELAAMDGGAECVTLDGPAGVRLRSSTVQTLAMALHELATNAIKYGALGQPAGKLAIRWRVEPAAADGRPWLHIDWRESGVRMPAIAAAPSGTGQGRELIERALPYQLRARTSYDLGPDGVHCTIAIPVSASTLHDGDPRGAR